MIITVYVAIGLSVFAMCFKLMQEEVVSKCKWLARHIGVLKRKVRKHKIERSETMEPKTSTVNAAPSEYLTNTSK